MKKLILSLLLLTSLAAFAQNDNERKEAFWVIENNVKSPKQSTVYFYTADQTLIYKETITGKKLKVNRPKTVRQLNTVLNQSVVAWQKEQVMRQDLHLVYNRR